MTNSKETRQRKAITFLELARRTSGDHAFASAIKKVDAGLLEYTCAVMEDSFQQFFLAEEAGDERRAELVKDVLFDAASVAMHHIDQTGVTAAVGGLAQHLRDFSFRENAACLAVDHVYLTTKLGIPDRKVQRLWVWVDEHRGDAVRMLSRPGFSLEKTVARARRRPLYYEGLESWQRMSPGGWLRLAGYALGCFNVGAAVGTLGLGTPVAVASVATGAIAVVAG
ncbi:MAG: hypothetical protein HY238_09115 [Acidobacteria bacterium]|nr:hypothetical protein [Acidobacteriota bacterium]